MKRRSLQILVVTICLALTGLGASVSPATAEQRVFTVTLTNGATVALTLEIAPGAPLDQVVLPAEIADYVYSVSDGTTTVLGANLKREAAPAAPSPDDSADDSSDAGQGAPIKKPDAQSQDEGSSGTGDQIVAGGDTSGDTTSDVPKPSNPTYSYALEGPAAIGVPNFFIDRFRIPPFLLPIYQAAGIEYGVRWEVLAAINEIETDYGRNLNVSSAGARGWMQFMPATWEQYGVDANNDGEKDPYNPVDAIFAAARYLRAAGAEKDLEKAIFAYNHADWYVDSVMMRAKLIAGMPADLVGSLTGLTQGRFPVDADATYAGAVTEPKEVAAGENPAQEVTSSTSRKLVRIYAAPGSNVIAVHDGKIVKIGDNFIQLRDVFGNTYTYSGLKSVAKTHEVPIEQDAAPAEEELVAPPEDPAPKDAASATKSAVDTDPAPAQSNTTPDERRVFANPDVPEDPADDAEDEPVGDIDNTNHEAPIDVEVKPLTKGATVTAGTVLGEIGKVSERSAHVEFSIRPAGRGAPRIDPKPILDGWKLLETTAIYRAAGKNPFVGEDADQPSIGQILLMSKETLARRVLNDPRIDIYECGRRDIEVGIIDRRVLATLEFLAVSGFEPTVTSLRCGHSRLTAGGNVSFHSSGSAVDIAKVNGIPILGHQGPDSITDQTVRKLLTLQGAMKPDEIITLAEYSGTDNTFALADHDDHIHVGFRPLSDSESAKQVDAALKPSQWNKLMDRLNQIENPQVSVKPSEFAISDTAKPDSAGSGD